MATVWDARLAARAAMTALVALGVVCLVGAATDEGVGWATRGARALPLAPAAGALGAYLALGPARARGELVALAALGRPPSRTTLFAALGGAAVSCLAALCVMAPSIDVRVFFPAVPRGTTYVFEGGAFVEHADGISVTSAGEITRIGEAVAVTAEGLPAGARLAAALATALVGGALALVGARARAGELGRTAAAVLVAAALVLVAFQASAASLVSVWTAPAIAAGLLAASALLYRRRDAI